MVVRITSFQRVVARTILSSFGICCFLSWVYLFTKHLQWLPYFFVATTWLCGSWMLGSSLLACDALYIFMPVHNKFLVSLLLKPWSFWWCAPFGISIHSYKLGKPSFLRDVCWALVCTTMLFIPYLWMISSFKLPNDHTFAPAKRGACIISFVNMLRM